MEELFKIISEHPASAVNVVALFLAGLFAKLLFGSFTKRLTKNEHHMEQANTRYEISSSEIKSYVKQLETTIATHKDDMGRAAKAINGDMLKMRERLFEIRQELVAEIDKFKSNIKASTDNLLMAQEITKITIKNYEEKLGRVILIEKDVETHKSQITALQEGVGSTKSTLSNNDRRFENIAVALEKHKKSIEALDKKTKKDPNGVS